MLFEMLNSYNDVLNWILYFADRTLQTLEKVKFDSREIINSKFDSREIINSNFSS